MDLRAHEQEGGVTMEQTPRPTLDVINLHSSHRLHSHRRKVMKRIIKAAMDLSKKEKKVISKIISRLRHRQKRYLGTKDSDPDPYDSDYIFYCLEGEREK
jgi:hypothetical protein